MAVTGKITGSVQVKNKKWYTVINLLDEKGKRKQKWEKTDLPERGNKKKAEKLLRERIAEYENSHVRYSDMLLSDYFEQWLEKIKVEVRPNTYHSYYGNMKNHIIPYFKNKKIRLQSLRANHLEEYYNFKLQPNSKINSTEALSATTIRHHHQNISKALTDAQTAGLIDFNPAQLAKPPKCEKYKAEYATTAQIMDILALFKGNAIEIPVVIASVYGLRRSEVLGLKWKYVDFENKKFTIAETLQQNTGGSYTDEPKTESSYRTLPMTASIYKLLNKQRENQEKRKELLGNYYVDSGYVCTMDNGNVIQPNYLTKNFHSVIAKSNLPKLTFHGLRHSVASNLINNGMSVLQVQHWLGHSSATTTLDFYGHVDAKSNEAVAKAIENMIDIQV